MSEVSITPAKPSDFLEFAGRFPPCRVQKAWAGRVDGVLLGVGGIAILPDAQNTRMGFMDLKEEGRRYPVALHKATLRFLQEFDESGIQRVVALMQEDVPRAAAWAKRLGFKCVHAQGLEVWIREREAA